MLSGIQLLIQAAQNRAEKNADSRKIDSCNTAIFARKTSTGGIEIIRVKRNHDGIYTLSAKTITGAGMVGKTYRLAQCTVSQGQVIPYLPWYMGADEKQELRVFFSKAHNRIEYANERNLNQGYSELRRAEIAESLKTLLKSSGAVESFALETESEIDWI